MKTKDKRINNNPLLGGEVVGFKELMKVEEG
jgi:hypothetical protein